MKRADPHICTTESERSARPLGVCASFDVLPKHLATYLHGVLTLSLSRLFGSCLLLLHDASPPQRQIKRTGGGGPRSCHQPGLASRYAREDLERVRVPAG